MVRLFFIVLGIAMAGSEPCPAACVAKLRQSLVSILASENFLVLVHQILRTEPNPAIVLQKSRWTCFKISSFETCIHKCPASPAKSALVTSLVPYNVFCKMTGKPNRGVLQYFRCERDLLLRAEEACEHFSVPADKNIKDLCRNMENYRQCYAGIPHRCTPNALKLKKRIDESLMETTENLVKITTGMVPSECSAWREQSLRQHEWRTAGEDEDDEEYEEDLDFTSFNNSYVNNTAQNSTFSKILYRPTKGAPRDDELKQTHSSASQVLKDSPRNTSASLKNVTYSSPDKLVTSDSKQFPSYILCSFLLIAQCFFL